uniref:Uncharacterized protein n=1 Tax=Arundo donax TaxID=35708 RepID=A0A0A9HSN5_ARUDO
MLRLFWHKPKEQPQLIWVRLGFILVKHLLLPALPEHLPFQPLLGESIEVLLRWRNRPRPDRGVERRLEQREHLAVGYGLLDA